MSTATKTFRAPSLAEALAQVRDDLGPEAVVVRRREGREGGVAGFFQKAVIEIDAQAGAPSVDVHDDDAPVMPDDAPNALAREAANAGFAAALATAQAKPHTDPAVEAIPQPRDSAPEVVPVARALAPAAHPESERVLGALNRAGLSDAFARTVVDEAAIHGLPFADEPAALRPLVARALARRIEVAPLSGPGAVAIVGTAGSGKTALVARLATAYATAGRLPVAVVALRPKDGGAELARLLAPAGVPLCVTDDAGVAAGRIANLRHGALVLVDTPALPAAVADPFQRDALGAELRGLGLDAIHLMLPAVLAGEVARDLVTAARDLGADRLAITHADATARVGMAIEVAIEARLPVSYLADTGAARPAAADDLAFALLP